MNERINEWVGCVYVYYIDRWIDDAHLLTSMGALGVENAKSVNLSGGGRILSSLYAICIRKRMFLFVVVNGSGKACIGGS